MDLSEVKKIIISILNSSPDGLYFDKLDKEFRDMTGSHVPYSQFGYNNVLQFLEEELAERIRIDKSSRWNTVLYPIFNEKSGHILKFKEKEDSDRRRHSPSQRNCAQQSQTVSAHRQTQNQQSEPRSASSAQSRQRALSPSMPRLVEYRPFIRKNTNYNSATANICGNENARNNLVRSHEAFRARTRHIQQSHAKQATLNRNQQSRTFNALRNQLSQNSSNNSGMHARLARMTLQNGGAQNKAQASTSQQGTAPTANIPTVKNTSAEESSASEEIENVWEDEIENMQPPTINRSNAISMYGVSDLSAKSPSPSSDERNEPHLQLQEISDDESSTKAADIPNLLGELHVGDVLKARVCDANNPLKFWVHIRQERFQTPINTMYSEMQKFYETHQNSPEYKVNANDGDSGYFAVEYNAQWHRVEPLDERMGEAVRISFIDHGTRLIMNTNKFRRLDERFWTTPKAAVCCGLGNVKPKEATFSTESAHKFIDLVEDQKVYVKILRIDNSKSKAIVELILDQDKVCVNDELVRLGHATKKSVWSNE